MLLIIFAKVSIYFMRVYTYFLLMLSFTLWTSCTKTSKPATYTEEEFNRKLDSMKKEHAEKISKAAEKNIALRKTIEMPYIKDSVRGNLGKYDTIQAPRPRDSASSEFIELEILEEIEEE